MPASDIRTHEVTFCSRVAGWANTLFAAHSEWPFRKADIEKSKDTKRKRSDIRIEGEAGKLILAGEVKMPGTKAGLSPYNSGLVNDAASKADNAAVEFFFTWNVNDFVLFDRKKWHLPILERRVKEYRLGLDLNEPEDRGERFLHSARRRQRARSGGRLRQFRRARLLSQSLT